LITANLRRLALDVSLSGGPRVKASPLLRWSGKTSAERRANAFLLVFGVARIPILIEVQPGMKIAAGREMFLAAGWLID
jgi:hypothetical protein